MAPPSRSSRRTVLAGALASIAAPGHAQERVRVFAAASLKPPLDVIAARWSAPVSVSYAGSGAAARQVAAGAPADVVILAAADWMDWLGRERRLGAVRVVARNALVLAGPSGSPPLALTPQSVLIRLGGGRLAMGDPLSVPAGRYGRQALEALGLWTALEGRLLLAENVRAALASVARGDVPLGLVYRSDALTPGVEAVASIPERAHDPIVYPAAATREAGPSARAFLDRVAASGPVFAAHGFRAA